MKRMISLLLTVLLCVGLFSGCCLKHEWADATCTDPRMCEKCGDWEGDPLGHDWRGATCNFPATCNRCGKRKGDPLGHTWQAATCYNPQNCVTCGEVYGSPLEHSYTEATDVKPSMCVYCGEMLPLPDPVNGQLFSGERLYWGQTLTIKCSLDRSCFVKVKDENYNEVMSFYVAAGCSAEVYVPAGYYYIYFAQGEDWYGPEYCFGPDTSYTMDDELTDYVHYSWTYTLRPSVDGNFTETPINPEDF